MTTARPRRSAVPWLLGLSVLLFLLSPLVFFGVLSTADNDGDILDAFVAGVADLTASVLVAVVAIVLMMRRGITRVRTAVTGHPQGRAARQAEQHAERWLRARARFTDLSIDFAAFEADRGAVARRPALADVSVPATERFHHAYRRAELLYHESERAEPRRREFVEAVDRAVVAWQAAERTADEIATPVPDRRQPGPPRT